MDITPDEDEMIASILKGRGVTRYDLTELLANWQALVENVERGYPLTIYDYRNDLGSRDLLDHVCRSAPGDLAGRIISNLSGADRRFMAATIEYPRGTVRSANVGRWWCFRKPTILLGELKKDFDDLERE